MLPPGRGIKPYCVRERLDNGTSWPEGKSPVPDWSKLDDTLPSILQPDKEEEEEEEEPEEQDQLDLDLLDVLVSPAHIHMLRSVDTRMHEICGSAHPDLLVS